MRRCCSKLTLSSCMSNTLINLSLHTSMMDRAHRFSGITSRTFGGMCYIRTRNMRFNRSRNIRWMIRNHSAWSSILMETANSSIKENSRSIHFPFHQNWHKNSSMCSPTSNISWKQMQFIIHSTLLGLLLSIMSLTRGLNVKQWCWLAGLANFRWDIKTLRRMMN